jgi:hypothetical protein
VRGRARFADAELADPGGERCQRCAPPSALAGGDERMTAAEPNDRLPTWSHPAPGTWADEAACRFEDPDLFFPPEEEHGRYAVLRETLAKWVCLRCPVLAECTAYALASDERYGVWGGFTPAERHRLRRARSA